MFIPDDSTATIGVCVCGAGYAMAMSGEFVTYTTSGDQSQRWNADTVSDGLVTRWDCPFCGWAEMRDVSEKVQS